MEVRPTNFEQQARRYLKASVNPHRAKTIAVYEGIAKNEPVEVLQSHFYNTAVTIRRLYRQAMGRGLIK